MLNDLKFTDAELAGNDISSLPDRPADAGITAAELKARFDKIPKMMVALGNFNTLIDTLTAESGAGEIGAAPAEGIEGGTVQAQLNSMSGKTAEAVKAAETAAAQGTAATQAAEAATQTAAEAAAAAQAATAAAATAAAQGEQAAAAAVLATNTVTEVKAYAEQQAQSAKDYVDEVILQAGTVASVFGRAGDITAQFGDYTAEQVSMAGYDSAAAAITEAIVLANTAGSAAEAAQNTADAAKAVTDTAGQPNGLATLDENGKLKQMPTADDVGAVNKAGDTMTGNLYMSKDSPSFDMKDTVKGSQALFCGIGNTAHLETRNVYGDIENRRWIDLCNSNQESYVKNALWLHDVVNGVRKGYIIHHAGNKPSGSYTGNGSATSRTIDTGGIGSCIKITSSNGFAIITDSGGIIQTSSGVTSIIMAECNFKNGVLTLASTDVRVNKANASYYYQVL